MRELANPEDLSEGVQARKKIDHLQCLFLFFINREGIESISLKAVYNTIHSINTNEFCTADPASAIKGTEITVTAETREGYEFDGWAVSDGVELTEDGKFTMPDHDVTIEAKYKQYHSIEVSKGVATDAEGNPISSSGRHRDLD